LIVWSAAILAMLMLLNLRQARQRSHAGHRWCRRAAAL